jgi:putative ABC transport system permease protein
MLSSLDRILSILKFSVGALGLIALLVGGVGVLTIMSMALSERIPEIGLLRALGASKGEILAMFLLESVLLSLLGGALGIALLALLAVFAHLLLPDMPLSIQPVYLLLGAGVSCAVGLIAGLSPALRAASLNPVDALRNE